MRLLSANNPSEWEMSMAYNVEGEKNEKCAFLLAEEWYDRFIDMQGEVSYQGRIARKYLSNQVVGGK